MPNIASIFKAEIARIARKESKAATAALAKHAAQQRSHIAALKRDLADLQRQLKALAKGTGKASAKASANDSDEAPTRAVRFSAKNLAKQR